MTTKKKVLLRLLFGFLYGAVIGNLIALFFGLLWGDGIVARELSDAVGLAGAVILQTFLSGILGTVSIGGMLFYKIDSWSLAKATALHFLSIAVCFVGVSMLLRWFPLRFSNYAIALGVMAFLFAVIWIVMDLRWKKEVKKMNEELDAYQKERAKGETK